MRPHYLHLLALIFAALSLAACATAADAPAHAGLSQDDDGYCRANGGPAGSSQYVTCRKSRDAQRSDAITRANREQRDFGEWMMNHPYHP
ncbi:MAG: hypothetical protein ACRECL_08125 [Bradyrhizobium sp.]